MSKHSVSVALGAAMFVVGLALIFLIGSGAIRGSASPGTSSSLASLEGRLEALEDLMATQAMRLKRLGLRHDVADVETRPTGEEGEPESPIMEEMESDETENPLDRLARRISDIETRLRGLEEDPVERGYAYLSSENPELRRQGILALERIAKHDPQAMASIREMLTDPDPRVRSTSIDTLADLGDKESIPAMVGFLADSEAQVRRQAIYSLAQIGARDAGMDIAGLLSDPDGGVRQAAADMLGKMKVNEGADMLLQALTDTREEVRGEVISSLGEVGAKAAIPQLRAIYDRDPGPHRSRLVHALRQLGDEQPLQNEIARHSKTALTDESEDARRRAIQILGWFAREQARPVFEQALQDPSERVRREARAALQPRDQRRGRR